MYIGDLHIHSSFSRATSRECDAAHLDLLYAAQVDKAKVLVLAIDGKADPHRI